MASFYLHYVMSPTAPFGLPDGGKIVLPAGAIEIAGRVIHVKSGLIAGHGTLPKYRDDAEALSAELDGKLCRLHIHDNFIVLSLDADSAQLAYEIGNPIVERMCNALSIQCGERFSAVFQFMEDESQNVSVRQEPMVIPLGTTGTYNIVKLLERFHGSFEWAQETDDRVDKSFLYVEHAFLLYEFAQNQPLLSRESAFSRSLAFLQLFKALSVILGEKGKDRDYQRRFRELGLPSNFWNDSVEPLYKVRNDEDVAHYRLSPMEGSAFTSNFGKALSVLSEAISAYISTKLKKHRFPAIPNTR